MSVGETTEGSRRTNRVLRLGGAAPLIARYGLVVVVELRAEQSPPMAPGCDAGVVAGELFRRRIPEDNAIIPVERDKRARDFSS